MFMMFTIQVAAENRPERFGWLLRHYDEVYTVLNFLLEQYYLRKYCKILFYLGLSLTV